MTKQCKKCGSKEMSPRGDCKACARDRARKWKLDNPEKVKAYTKVWLDKNKEINKQNCARWYRNNINRAKEYSLTWQRSNKEKVKAISHNYRARLNRADGEIRNKDIEFLLEAQKYKCAVCKTCVKDKYHVDHIVALVNGGSNYKENLQILCVSCNTSKRSQDPIVFMQRKGFLI